MWEAAAAVNLAGKEENSGGNTRTREKNKERNKKSDLKKKNNLRKVRNKRNSRSSPHSSPAILNVAGLEEHTESGKI